GASITARGVSLNPTRTGMLAVLRAMGADVRIEPTGLEAGEPVGDLTVVGADRPRPFDFAAQGFASRVPSLIDELPALAVAAARVPGVSRIDGAQELRVKETDRIAALAAGLRGVGIEVEESPAGLAIHGGVVRGGTVDARGDHRIAMAFAVLGTMAAAKVAI